MADEYQQLVDSYVQSLSMVNNPYMVQAEAAAPVAVASGASEGTPIEEVAATPGPTVNDPMGLGAGIDPTSGAEYGEPSIKSTFNPKTGQWETDYTATPKASAYQVGVQEAYNQRIGAFKPGKTPKKLSSLEVANKEKAPERSTADDNYLAQLYREGKTDEALELIRMRYGQGSSGAYSLSAVGQKKYAQVQTAALDTTAARYTKTYEPIIKQLIAGVPAAEKAAAVKHYREQITEFERAGKGEKEIANALKSHQKEVTAATAKTKSDVAAKKKAKQAEITKTNKAISDKKKAQQAAKQKAAQGGKTYPDGARSINPTPLASPKPAPTTAPVQRTNNPTVDLARQRGMDKRLYGG